MYEIFQRMRFCYAHRLLDHKGKCKRIHGHDAVVQIYLCSDQLNEAGMVWDFSDLKRKIKSWIDETLDHRMLLHQGDPLIDVLEEVEDSCLVLPVKPTAENLAKLIFEQCKEMGIPLKEVRFWETPNACAIWRE